MLKSILIASVAVLALASVPANAKQERQVTRTIWEITDFPKLAENAQMVCDNAKLNKSDKLKAACATKAWPSVTKAGAFRNTGIGAELNALMRQDAVDNQGH